ncbi:MAG: PP0621 family protein [Pseudomonadota bacterium]
MSTKLLFWLALLILVVFAVRKKMRVVPRPGQSRGGARDGAAPQAEGEAMSCCAHCGVYFPASEAVSADGLAYCSPAHVRLPPPK